MTSMWDYRADVVTTDNGIVGCDVEATDGSIGTIDESSADAGASYVVVDTGFWIFGKKRLIPAAVIRRVEDNEGGRGTVYVSMTKEQVKDAPDFAESHRADRDEAYNYYEPYGQV